MSKMTTKELVEYFNKKDKQRLEEAKRHPVEQYKLPDDYCMECGKPATNNCKYH